MKIHYASLGEGPLVVMLHGFPDFWYTWRHQMEALGAERAVIVGHDWRQYVILTSVWRQDTFFHMRQKISTLIDPALYRRVKLEAVSRNKQISEIVGEALERYLDRDGRGPRGTGVVQESWGALRLPRQQVEQILEEEDGLYDA